MRLGLASKEQPDIGVCCSQAMHGRPVLPTVVAKEEKAVKTNFRARGQLECRIRRLGRRHRCYNHGWEEVVQGF